MGRFYFYKQRRGDGGVRYGIQTEQNSAWMHFDPGADTADDPGLEWYVDVEFTGESLNGDPECAIAMFRRHTELIREALAQVIDKLLSDDRVLVWPVSSQVIQVANGIKLKVVCSAIRRIQARTLAQGLTDLRDNWNQYLDRLQVVDPVAAS